MSKVKVSAVAKLFDPIGIRLRPYVSHAANLLYAQVKEQVFQPGWMVDVYVFPDAVRFSDPYQIDTVNCNPRVSVTLFAEHVSADTWDAAFKYEDVVLQFHTDLHCLMDHPSKFSAYSVMFDVDSDDSSFNQVKVGYIGITGRSPLTRFREHLRKASIGSGSILHRTWAALSYSGIKYVPMFSVYAMDLKTLQAAYEFEERSVERSGTLSPEGLNAIPGGMAGIRMMHELRLLAGSSPVSLEKRDEAIEKLLTQGSPASKATHYRAGHVRKLEGGRRTTWVRSCWVNLPEAVAA